MEAVRPRIEAFAAGMLGGLPRREQLADQPAELGIVGVHAFELLNERLGFGVLGDLVVGHLVSVGQVFARGRVQVLLFGC